MEKPSALSVGRECSLRVADRRYTVQIVAVAEDTIGISGSDELELEEGAGVELELPDHYGTAHYHTRVVVAPKDSGDGAVLQRCEARDYVRHRRSWRVPTDLRVQVAPASGIPNRDGRLLDLSSEGAMVATPATFKLGDPCRITVTLPGQTTCSIPGRIVHTASGTDDAMNHYGVRFDDLPKQSRHSLTWYLYDQIRKHYGDELRALYPRRSAGRSAPKKRTTEA